MLQRLIGFFFFISFSVASAQTFSVPELHDPVNDYAGIISSDVQAQLNQALRKLQEAGGTQIAVLTVTSLHGLAIEQASIQVVDKWQLGGKAKDNGILLFIAKDEKKIRIEVGQGAEGDLTDSYSKRIIDESMTPLFRSGNISEGILVGAFQIAQVANPNIDVEPIFSLKQNWSPPRKHLSNLPTLLFFLLFFVILIISSTSGPGGTMGRRGFGRGGYGGGGFGGRGGGGFSSGGFSGGGGGFSGGGASGGW